MNKSPSIQTAQSQFIIYFSINPREKKVPKHPSSKKKIHLGDNFSMGNKSLS